MPYQQEIICRREESLPMLFVAGVAIQRLGNIFSSTVPFPSMLPLQVLSKHLISGECYHSSLSPEPPPLRKLCCNPSNQSRSGKLLNPQSSLRHCRRLTTASNWHRFSPETIYCNSDAAWRQDSKSAGLAWIFSDQGNTEITRSFPLLKITFHPLAWLKLLQFAKPSFMRQPSATLTSVSEQTPKYSLE